MAKQDPRRRDAGIDAHLARANPVFRPMLEALRDAVAETLKYSVKPSDMTSDAEWLLEMTRQVHKLRFIASGGVLKDILKEGEESERDLLLADEQGEGKEKEKPDLYFDWRKEIKRYSKRR